MEESALGICSLMEENKRKRPYASRRTWSRYETKTLLVFANNRKEEFTHVKKRKYVYDNLVEDLTSCGVSELPFYPEQIKNKLKTLKNAYKSAIDSNNRTGAAPVIAPYMELMDEIYGYINVAPESPDSLACSVGIGRQETQEKNKRKRPYASRRTWSRTETKTLLVFVNNRKEEFTHEKKRKYVYDNLVEDLTSCGVSEIPFYPEQIKNKLKTLKNAYKSAIDSNNRTGAAPLIAPYMELMDEIYGYDNVPPESSESLARSVRKGRQELQENINSEQLFESLIDVSVPDTDGVPISPYQGLSTSASCHLNNNKKYRQELPENINSNEFFGSLIDVSIPGTNGVPISPSQGSSTSASSHLNNNKKISVKERLLNRKLKFIKEMVELKETGKRERFRMKENAKEKRHVENKEWQQKLLNILTKRNQ